MRLFKRSLSLVFLLAFMALPPIAVAVEDDVEIIEAVVVRVVDAHTLDVAYQEPSGGVPSRIRAYLIDGPLESSSPSRACFASEAEGFLEDFLVDRTVWIAHYDRELSSNRLLGLIYLDSRLETLAQVVIVSQGWAEVRIRYDEELPYRNELAALEEEALAERRGIWGECNVQNRDSEKQARILINELEMNPEGSDRGNEWIELYNTEDEAINLDDWRIVATDGSHRTFIVPSETRISAHGVLVLGGFKGDFFHNTGDVVELRNGQGDVIDRTSKLRDIENDNRCWARTPNGSNKWSFRTCTRGGGNGS